MNNRLLIVGPPGSGKGTQAVYIAKHYNIANISTGDIFRDNIKNKTSLGLEVKKYTDAGEYVPDALINNMMNSRLNNDDTHKGFLLDGYPRTYCQIKELDKILEKNNHKLDAVIELLVNEEELIERMLVRSQKLGRIDDTLDVIRHRQRIYHEQTEPLLKIYKKRNIVKQINGVGDFSHISEEIFSAIDDLLALQIH